MIRLVGGECEARDAKMIQYFGVRDIMRHFSEIEVMQLSRKDNFHANALV